MEVALLCRDWDERLPYNTTPIATSDASTNNVPKCERKSAPNMGLERALSPNLKWYQHVEGFLSLKDDLLRFEERDICFELHDEEDSVYQKTKYYGLFAIVPR
ncbi:hypothetical protein AVEN_69772-1 [Araneus ventricosus]|uniref:Uncharacterized protein n=1 Tax=Araneus ventricosus TaxID=182803 RepID=A0A4Y2CZ42_ARAVE|nr:hypothetical protein AVEN_69772-1 [Araneus ventricosus]